MPENILVIVVDCLRADFIYAPQRAPAPTIDRLKIKGHSFVNTYSSTATTTPNFAALLTGLYPFENGVRTHQGYALPARIKTIPQHLQEKGYHTYAEVTGPLGREIQLDRGFDEYHFRDQKQTIHTDYGASLREKFQRHFKAPWFVLLHIWSLHTPRIVIEECRGKKYGTSQYGRALASIDKFLGQLLPLVGEDTLICFTSDHGECIAKSAFDGYIKSRKRKLIKHYRQKHPRKTHVSHYMRDCWIGHGISNYQELVRIPVILHHRQIKPGVSTTQIRQIDILPTILDIQGVPLDPSVTGKSAVGVMSGKDRRHRDAYMEAVSPMIPEEEGWLSTLCVDNQYKFIRPWNERFGAELYDLQADPAERNNICAGKPEIGAAMSRQIEQIRAEEKAGEEMSDEDQSAVQDRLRSLGYLE